MWFKVTNVHNFCINRHGIQYKKICLEKSPSASNFISPARHVVSKKHNYKELLHFKWSLEILRFTGEMKISITPSKMKLLLCHCNNVVTIKNIIECHNNENLVPF